MGLLLWGQQAVALEATVTAQYRAQASGRFENTTPLASFCQRWPSECAGTLAMKVPITYTKTTVTGDPDYRNRYYLQMPGVRQVDVFHDQTGEHHTLRFELTGVSQTVVASSNYGVNPVWTRYPQGGCRFRQSYLHTGRPYPVRYLWELKNSSSPTSCYSDPQDGKNGEVIDNDVSEMGISYTLDMPAPYRMKPGIYRGSVTYSIGPGADFDFGNAVSNLNGSSLTLNFVLDVQHAFIFDFPPGSERAVLEPPGGWQAWLGGRGAPERLLRDLPFRLWSTGPFKVYKLCRYYAGNGCGIRNRAGHQVPVDIALSLPGGIQHAGGAVQRLLLPTGRDSALAFDSVTPVFNRPGQLHFEVGKQDVRTMLDHPGSRYEGEATVVFDAQL
ncbi:hypothetical protein ACIPW4_24815 [Pseudomonas sp. NPDC089996]|uniref:hypothetical protein n=1 Tax=Pseudomonas sp. NPDC089996 TaxID=3364474 RepID=UPI0037F5F97A